MKAMQQLAGIIEEMLEDTMEGLGDEEELEEEVQGEVDKILAELTDGKLGEAPKVPEGSLVNPSQPQQVEEEEEEDDDLERCRADFKLSEVKSKREVLCSMEELVY